MMIFKQLKEKAIKADKYDKLVKIIQSRADECGLVINKYQDLPENDIGHIMMSGYIDNFYTEKRCYDGLLDIIKGS